MISEVSLHKEKNDSEGLPRKSKDDTFVRSKNAKNATGQKARFNSTSNLNTPNFINQNLNINVKAQIPRRAKTAMT